MRAVQALMMLFGALAVLMTAAAPASARGAASSTPPCHQAAMAQGGAETPSPTPGKAVKSMDCCVACVATPTLRSPERTRAAAQRPVSAARPAALPPGERPAPEPHPPRSIAL